VAPEACNEAPEDRDLDEFVFRFDRRWQESELFIRVLHRALDAAPLPYHRLTAERIG